jgi:hypothetical protein
MKRIILALFCILSCTNAFSQSPSPCATPSPRWDTIANLKERIQNSKSLKEDKKDELIHRYYKIQDIDKGYLNGTNEWCRELAEYDRQKQLYHNEVADQNAEAKLQVADAKQQNADAANYNSQCAGQVTQSQYASCLEWKNRVDNWENEVNNWKNKIDNWKTKLDNWDQSLVDKARELNQKRDRFNAKIASSYDEFIKDAKLALTAGFTGTKAYHLTAKSWINTDAISEPSINGLVGKLAGNIKPTRPNLIGNVDDFKLFQSFDVEVKFVDGIVTSAKFLNVDLEVGKTFGLIPGIFRVKNVHTSPFGSPSVTFTRTVEAKNKVLFLKEWFFEEHQSPDIYNTISIEVFADSVKTHGYASDFPTTFFWIDQDQLAPKLQVQPADFFR